MTGKIDVHTHVLPDFFVEKLNKMKEGTSGVPKIDWTMESTKHMNANLGVSTSVFSLSAPGPEVDPDRDGARSLARRYNEWAAKERNADPARFGFFAAVPSLSDTDGCLAEIRYAFDNLQADGLCLFTTYGGLYLGDSTFEPIWKELNERNAVVFIHPNMPPGFKLASPMLQPPAFDFPHETGRTAAHMIVTGMKRRYPNTKIILSHAGGTLPILSERLAYLESHLFAKGLMESSPKTSDEFLEDAKSFYFDLALSGTANVLDCLVNWAPQSHILYGSDYPYATVEAEYNTKQLESYPLAKDVRDRYYAKNGLKLFPRLREEAQYKSL